MISGKSTKVTFDGKEDFDGTLLCDIIHPEGASVLAKYDSEFYSGVPAVTENQMGQGTAWHVGTRLDHDGLSQVIERVVQTSQIKPLVNTSTPLEITKRTTVAGQDLYFVLNLQNQAATLPKELVGFTDLLTGKQAQQHLASWDVEILTK